MSEISDLGRDLMRAPVNFTPAVVRAFNREAKDFRDKWRKTAKRTARRHGKHYPKSITHEVTTAGLVIQADVGPESGKLQGSMGRGFEFGSENQRPHLDGARYLRATESKFERAAAEAIDPHIPGLDG